MGKYQTKVMVADNNENNATENINNLETEVNNTNDVDYSIKLDREFVFLVESKVYVIKANNINEAREKLKELTDLVSETE